MFPERNQRSPGSFTAQSAGCGASAGPLPAGCGIASSVLSKRASIPGKRIPVHPGIRLHFPPSMPSYGCVTAAIVCCIDDIKSSVRCSCGSSKAKGEGATYGFGHAVPFCELDLCRDELGQFLTELRREVRSATVHRLDAPKVDIFNPGVVDKLVHDGGYQWERRDLESVLWIQDDH